jgi:TPR repeat protein
MWELDPYEDLEEKFQRFERAAAKGHEESIWILSVWRKDVDMEKNALKEAFVKTEEPLGWYFAGMLSDRLRERYDFYKKSAEGGCSWAQVDYGLDFRFGDFVEKDMKVYVEWMEKAANQNNPQAMRWLGDWFRTDGGDKEKAVSYYRAAAELGWKYAMYFLAEMLRNGEGCAKELRRAVIWGAKGNSHVFLGVLENARLALERGTTHYLDCDFDQLCY